MERYVWFTIVQYMGSLKEKEIEHNLIETESVLC